MIDEVLKRLCNMLVNVVMNPFFYDRSEFIDKDFRQLQVFWFITLVMQ